MSALHEPLLSPAVALPEPLVHLRREGPLATVTLMRPERQNRLTPGMLVQLELCARELDADGGVRVVVLTGCGEQAFCAGADIGAWAELEPLDRWRDRAHQGHLVLDQWARLRQPVICALNGNAFGGGLELALAADIRLAAESAQFALPEAAQGGCPAWSGTQRLVQLIGASRAKYLALTGARFSAGEALRAGLVHEVLPAAALQRRAHELALRMAATAPLPLQLTKQLVNAAAGEGAPAVLEAMAVALAAVPFAG